MKILGIETSCDETAAAVVEDGVRILSNVVVSQIDIFAEYGGVIPEVAARSHLEAILPVIDKALADAGCDWGDIDAIAVTHAPGLLGSLLIGTLTARTLAILHNKPLYAVHHLKSHVYANWLNGGVRGLTESVFSDAGLESASTSYAGTRAEPSLRDEPVRSGRNIRALDSNLTFMHPKKQTSATRTPTFPLLALVVSGGHTQILYMPGHNQFEIIGTTRDDAVGECFDKVAKILGLPYPGGPSIAKAALDGNADKYKFPHPKVGGLDFSFSGLKTAVLRTAQKEVGVPISYPSHKLKDLLTPKQVADFAASFQKTAAEILVEKLKMALTQYSDAQSIVVAGGVSANQELRVLISGLTFSSAGLENSGTSYAGQQGEPPAAQANLSVSSGIYVPEFSNQTVMPTKKLSPDIRTFFPDLPLAGDNGAMVAAACYFEIQSGVEPVNPYRVNIYPRISIED